ncbi:MAG TPA: ATP-binding protein [Lentimicrobium sp.]|nr:ATP-binding protein [Lentimicrobium sp.]
MSSDSYFSIIAGFILLILLYLIYRRFVVLNEFEQFIKSIEYRDFSRHYEINKKRGAIRRMRKGFNKVNETFRVLSKEKEMQYQYLQTVLEMVDTGIISYELNSGRVMWMNEAVKVLLEIPYLKTIRSLEKRDKELFSQINALEPGKRIVSSIKRNKSTTKVMLSATIFIQGNLPYKLVVFQNVNEALDETESLAWQKLLSVMTHEIMNSVAPISSLAHTLENSLRGLTIEINETTIRDIGIGIETIRKRSEGLHRFAEVYRNLYKITAGKFKKVKVSEMFENIHRLMLPKFEQMKIETEIIMKEPLMELNVDKSLIEQVLINLILNAADAVKESPDPKIVISSFTDNDDHPIIKVADNGSGIPEDILDKIFIPFFSTKKNGNGIGLSLCKQIMQVHKGSISVQSVMNQGTAVYLRF